MAKKNITIGSMVNVAVLINPCNGLTDFKGCGKVTKIRTNKVGVKEYQVNGSWEVLESLTLKTINLLNPTEKQMSIIKSAYPILKKDKHDIKVIYERGNIFAFKYTKDNEDGYRMYDGNEFTKMNKKDIERYAYGR